MDIERFVRGDMSPGDTVYFLIRHASLLGASDIHMDTTRDGVHIRLRVDGLLRTLAVLPYSAHSGISVCIKVLAKIRTDIHYIPQDGRISMDIDQKRFDYRLSTIPSHYGECFVLRVLLNEALPTSLSGLGFTEGEICMIEKSLNDRRGMILVTGPTGSGKTSTLYNLLNLCDRESELVITLEDPVEYTLSGVRQIPIRDKYGLTFATALRSVLRQDPDTIMLGEVRDAETAKIAVEASLTGHRLFTTLHTDRVWNAVPRLLEMGIDIHMIVSTVSLVIAQRLVRKICQRCLGKKCAECHMTGYKGRTVISELLHFDDHVKEILLKTKNINDLKSYLYANSFFDFKQNAKEKISNGITDQAEIMRVFNYKDI